MFIYKKFNNYKYLNYYILIINPLTPVLKWYIFYIRVDLTSEEMNSAQEAEPQMWVRQSIHFAHIPHVRLLQYIETFFSDSLTVIILTNKLFNLKIF